MLPDNPGDLPTPPAPTLQIRRPQARVVTQTIERAATTYTTHVTLGLGDGGETPGPAPPAPAAPPAGTVNSAPGYNYIGAIVGSVVAFVFLLLLLWCCICKPRMLRRQRQLAAARDGYSSGYDSEGSLSSGGPAQPRPRPRPRVPPMPVLNPPPVRIKPMRHTGWTHSAHPQIRGVRAFP
ncbi:hypothetical protein MCOR29_005796 [Pyricularia oryzae]|nr:hypothetical protein MCOR26_010454 [Pyricularia oryzae]KAI6318805.1 hypothetical protein MCOR29_005796 [Pyricularia oryzae]KAI6332551.1 hypothetical protein MCOR30_004525 [Pyricularia oryzae]KAI6343939.1 hypothetical protein MCOR28_004503 [Pyricularia oryzae]KAI6386898.1 hypothetical protein MCOR32_000679 [Pyricularia oryzae]